MARVYSPLASIGRERVGCASSFEREDCSPIGGHPVFISILAFSRKILPASRLKRAVNKNSLAEFSKIFRIRIRRVFNSSSVTIRPGNPRLLAISRGLQNRSKEIELRDRKKLVISTLNSSISSLVGWNVGHERR